MGDAIQEEGGAADLGVPARCPPCGGVAWHASQWNLDPQRIAVAGSSRGPPSAALVALRGSVPIRLRPTRWNGFLQKSLGGSPSDPCPHYRPPADARVESGCSVGRSRWGCSFAESPEKRDELLPMISQWSPGTLCSTRIRRRSISSTTRGLTKPGRRREKWIIGSILHAGVWDSEDGPRTRRHLLPEVPRSSFGEICDVWGLPREQLGSAAKAVSRFRLSSLTVQARQAGKPDLRVQRPSRLEHVLTVIAATRCLTIGCLTRSHRAGIVGIVIPSRAKMAHPRLTGASGDGVASGATVAAGSGLNRQRQPRAVYDPICEDGIGCPRRTYRPATPLNPTRERKNQP